jgi:hypothetical protein
MEKTARLLGTRERKRHDKQSEVKFKTMWRRDKSAGIGSA